MHFLQVYGIYHLRLPIQVSFRNGICQLFHSLRSIFLPCDKFLQNLKSLIGSTEIINGEFDAIADLRLHPNGIFLCSNRTDTCMLFQQELVFQILQFLYFFKDTVLIIYQIQIMDDLLLDYSYRFPLL